jgi:hypothetical protein
MSTSDTCVGALRRSAQGPGTMRRQPREAGRLAVRAGALRVPHMLGAAHRAAHKKSSSAAACEAVVAPATRGRPALPSPGWPGAFAAMPSRPASDGKREQRVSRASREGQEGKDGRGFVLVCAPQIDVRCRRSRYLRATLTDGRCATAEQSAATILLLQTPANCRLRTRQIRCVRENSG